MYTFLSVVYILVCLFLIFVVLLQPGRGGMGSAFGGGSSQTVFGASGGANFLQKLTTVSAALFMLLSVTLAYMSSSSDKSLERAAEAARAKAAAKLKLQEANQKTTEQTGSPSDSASESTSPAPIELAPGATPEVPDPVVPAPEAPAVPAPAAPEAPAEPASPH